MKMKDCQGNVYIVIDGKKVDLFESYFLEGCTNKKGMPWAFDVNWLESANIKNIADINEKELEKLFN